MMNQKKYWKGLEELNESPAFVKARDKEFAKEVPIEEFLGKESIATSNTSRRDFLKYLGFTVAAASLAACESPVVKTIPYVIKPEEITPGVNNWYASTFFNGEDYCSVLIKTRDGRPIKIEGNPKSSITKGAVNARVHASVLSLYDNYRATAPYEHGGESTWEKVDKEIGAKLAAAAAKGDAKGNIVILSSTIISPSTHGVIADFTAKYPTAKHVMWDAVSFSGIRKANELYFGKATIPSYSFDKAKTIVSISADFLTNWLSPIEFSKQYADGRRLTGGKKDMSKHIQFESIMTVSGANADTRIQIKPSEEGAVALSLCAAVGKLAGTPVSATATPYDDQISKIAAELWANKGQSLIVAGSNDSNVQSVVNMINKTLGNYGTTINMNRECNLRQGSDEDFAALVSDMKAGKVDVLITYNTNPVYTSSAAAGFKDAYAKVPCKISLAPSVDETATTSDYVCPDHNQFESWNDANPYSGQYSLQQPTISPLFAKPRNEGTRCAQETLLKWAGSDTTDYMTYMQNNWKKNILSSVSDEGGDYQFTNLWNTTLQGGLYEKTMDNTADNKSMQEIAAPSMADVSSKIANAPKGGLEVVLYQKTSIGSGIQANNPWLQELPDPISKVTWDNYITMNPAEMKEKGFSLLEEDNHVASVATLTVNGSSIELPVFPQPGQARGTVGVAVGYGRTNAGVVANGVGVNVFPWVQWTNNTFQYYVAGAQIASANKTYNIAATQTHNTMIGRPILKEATLEEYRKNPGAGNEQEEIKTLDGMKPLKDVNLWDDFDKKSPVNLTNNADNQGLRWKMAIDLNTCIGCGACSVSCTAENNVPVVGKDEIVLVREMHWIRIDRYYSSDMSWEKAKADDISESNRMYDMMVPSADNPEVAFQPVMCQHCNHAPCETVCPVMATSHGSEGINQMAYNRCVGTKYCANNCPYKVRRFNWFNYYRDEKFLNVNPAQESNELGRMVLNPDVVVRSRGVMEKCSLCVQRIQSGKLKAKMESRTIKDGEIVPACAQSCPTQAIVFGNVNDPESKVADLIKDERNYLLLADLDTQPNVFYMTKIRNKDKAILE